MYTLDTQWFHATPCLLLYVLQAFFNSVQRCTVKHNKRVTPEIFSHKLMMVTLTWTVLLPSTCTGFWGGIRQTLSLMLYSPYPNDRIRLGCRLHRSLYFQLEHRRPLPREETVCMRFFPAFLFCLVWCYFLNAFEDDLFWDLFLLDLSASSSVQRTEILLPVLSVKRLRSSSWETLRYFFFREFF